MPGMGPGRKGHIGAGMNVSLRIDTKGALLTGRSPQIIQAGLDRFVAEATMLLLAEVKKRTPQGVFGAQGGLLGSIQGEPIIGKGTPMVKGAVVSAHEYAEVIEKGRAAGKGMPPKYLNGKDGELTLVRWIEVKMGLSEDQAKKIEFVVRRSIGKKGFKGAHMFEKALIENLNRLRGMGEDQGLKLATELSQ